MADLYFGIRLIAGILPLGILVLFFLFYFIRHLIFSLKHNRIKKYLISIGYERRLISTASVGNNHTYGYIRPNNNGWNDIIRDYELNRLSVKQVKQKYI